MSYTDSNVLALGVVGIVAGLPVVFGGKGIAAVSLVAPTTLKVRFNVATSSQDSYLSVSTVGGGGCQARNDVPGLTAFERAIEFPSGGLAALELRDGRSTGNGVQAPVPSVAYVAPGGGPPIGPAGGDLGNTFPNPSVDGIRGTPVNAVAPAVGQVLVYNGVDYAPAAPPGGAPSGPAGGDLGNTFPNPSVDGIQGVPVNVVAPADKQALVFNGVDYTPSYGVGDIGGNVFVAGQDGASTYSTVGAALTALVAAGYGTPGNPGVVQVKPGNYVENITVNQASVTIQGWTDPGGAGVGFSAGTTITGTLQVNGVLSGGFDRIVFNNLRLVGIGVPAAVVDVGAGKGQVVSFNSCMLFSDVTGIDVQASSLGVTVDDTVVETSNVGAPCILGQSSFAQILVTNGSRLRATADAVFQNTAGSNGTFSVSNSYCEGDLRASAGGTLVATFANSEHVGLVDVAAGATANVEYANCYRSGSLNVGAGAVGTTSLSNCRLVAAAGTYNNGEPAYTVNLNACSNAGPSNIGAGLGPINYRNFTSDTVAAPPLSGQSATPNAVVSVDYQAASLVNWSGTNPTSVQDALDRIAAAIGPIA